MCQKRRKWKIFSHAFQSNHWYVKQCGKHRGTTERVADKREGKQTNKGLLRSSRCVGGGKSSAPVQRVGGFDECLKVHIYICKCHIYVYSHKYIILYICVCMCICKGVREFDCLYL